MNIGTKKLSPEEIEKIKELYLAGNNLIQIGRETKRHHTTVLFHLKKLGIYNRHIKIEKKCAGCGKDFLSYSYENRKYCSPKCYHRESWKSYREHTRPEEMKCKTCGKEIPRECILLNDGKCFMCNFKAKRVSHIFYCQAN